MGILTCEGRKTGSLERGSLKGSLLQKKINERGVYLGVTKKTTVFRDPLFASFADPVERDGYADAVKAAFPQERLAEGTNEDLLRAIFSLRASLFGDAPYRAIWKDLPEEAPLEGLDQTALCETLWQKNVLLFYLSSPDCAADLRRDLERAAAAGKTAFCLVFPGDPVLPRPGEIARIAGGLPFLPLEMPGQNGCCDLGAVPENEILSRAVREGDAAFFAYGEDAFLCCRALTLPASATVLPVGLFARALTGLFTRPARSRLYIPAGFDLTPYVPTSRPSRLSFYHLAALSEQLGEDAYRLTPEEAAAKMPGLFFRFYDDHLPPRPSNGTFSGGDLPAAREAFWQKKLSALPGIRPLHACFDLASMERVAPRWDAEEPDGRLLIDGVIASPGVRAEVKTFEGRALSPRRAFFDRREKGGALLSNFAFFFTRKLTAAYNDLRRDRPKEQIASYSGTVGYSRYTDSRGVRHETIPLYAKSCLAAGKDGFSVFHFEAGGGEISLAGEPFRWERENVNAPGGEVTLYTPLLSRADSEADPLHYRLSVGEGALNAAIVGETVLCIRRGEVFLPCIGAVLSLKGEAAERLARRLPEPDDEGYFQTDGLSLSVCMDPPEEFPREAWDRFDWIFGGGMGLIDGEGEVTAENYLQRFEKEGWLTPLSRQTQESELHRLSRHPRTAVGTTKKGEMVILVYSGRSAVSVGADYPEMVRTARELVPDLDRLVNWDGGGSSVLGILENDVFTELSLPAPSDESIAGMARPVSSILMIRIKENET